MKVKYLTLLAALVDVVIARLSYKSLFDEANRTLHMERQSYHDKRQSWTDRLNDERAAHEKTKRERDGYLNKTFTLQNDLYTRYVKNVFYQTLLGIRKRLEQLENFLYPKDFPVTKNRYVKWIAILTTVQSSFVFDLLKAIKSCNMSVEEFSHAASDLYGSDSNVIHLNIDIPDIPLEVLDVALETHQVNLPSHIRGALNVLLKQPKLPSSLVDKDTTSNVQACITMNNVPFTVNDAQNVREIPGGKIRGFFKADVIKNNIRQICETEDSYTADGNEGLVVIKFGLAQHAVGGLLENSRAIDGTKIDLSLVDCDPWLEKCHPQNNVYYTRMTTTSTNNN